MKKKKQNCTDKNIYITKSLIKNDSFGELDFVLYDEFGFDYEIYDDFVTIEKGQGQADGFPVKIDQMIEKLQQMKNEGATHVEISYHCDHFDYEISGYKIETSSQEDINERNNGKNIS